MIPFLRHAAPLLLVSVLLQGCERETGTPAEGDAASSAAAVVPTPVEADGLQRSVISEVLPYAEVEDELVYGHFAFPSDMIDPLPAVIFIHERWGLTDGVRNRADRLASEGFIVLAIDLFGGITAGNPGEARELMVSVVENAAQTTDNIRQAYEFLASTAGAPSVATLGYGFGGGWSLNAAIQMPDSVDAVVIYYGQVTDDDDRLRALDAPILGLFASDDRAVPKDSVRQFEAALERLGKEFDIHVYPDARAAFADPSAETYDRELAEDAWRRTVEFLSTRLAADGS